MDVALVIPADGMLFELAIAREVFGEDRSELAGVPQWYRLRTVALDAPLVDGFTTAPDGSYADLVGAHTVVVPAWRELDAAPAPALLEALVAAHEAGARIVSLCTGAFVLAAAGLLDGRRATTHWEHAPLLARRYPRVQVDPDVLYVDEGSVLTSAGKAAAMDLCLHLVRTDFGAAAANAVARTLVVPPHRDGGQAQFVASPRLRPTADPIGGLLDWCRERLAEPLSVADLARHAGLSTRQLTRRFVSVTGQPPQQWLHAERIRVAQELLETSDATIDVIADRSGMGTATTLRRHFRAAVGVTPTAYRNTFGRPAIQV